MIKCSNCGKQVRAALHYVNSDGKDLEYCIGCISEGAGSLTRGLYTALVERGISLLTKF